MFGKSCEPVARRVKLTKTRAARLILRQIQQLYSGYIDFSKELKTSECVCIVKLYVTKVK